MHMAAQHGFDVAVLGDDIHQVFGIFQLMLVNPARLHGERMMVAGDNHMLLRLFRQNLIQLLQLLLRDPAIDLACDGAVQQHNPPCAETEHMRLIALLMKGEKRGVVMVAGNLKMRKALLLHVLELDDAAAITAHIQQRYERPLMEIFE